MDIHGRPVLFYRWGVFLLAGGYAIWKIWQSDYTETGGPFRFLTIWALLMSFFAASRMLAITEGRSDLQWAPVIGATAALNAMVVILYWRMYLEDPAMLSTGPLIRHEQWYLHAVGPALQWFDMLFIWRGFRRYLPAAGVLIAITLLYIGWTEGIVAPGSALPRGSETSGLPYPFLNDMDVTARVNYYATVAAAGLVVLALFRLVAGGVRLIFRPLAREKVG
ncbi:MAG: hypothetical protein AAGF74_05570 [Pseudomonadota bacterium]